MFGHRLILATAGSMDISDEEQIALFHRVGFDGFFVNWRSDKPLDGISAKAKELGMLWQSVHAPYVRMRCLWYPDEGTEATVAEQIECLKACARYEVPLMVAHAFIGFADHEPTEAGIENYGKIVREAEKLGVKIAFENTEGEEYLAALMQAFGDCRSVGFCWDTGHEMCYNYGKDMLALYGDRLFGTHINDNLGIRDFGGAITCRDDFHLLPFDGIGDWQNAAARLCRYGFTETLTFELNPASTPCGVCRYARMSREEYVAEAYLRACRIAALCDACTAKTAEK